MLGIDYESSDEETAPVAKPPETIREVKVNTVPKHDLAPTAIEEAANGSVNSPAQGLFAAPPPAVEGPPDEAAPGSPYTSTRSVIQNLTLPTVPNFSIPPSPPGSPPQRSTTKFAQFLDLKKKGQHFNQRLESSTVLRDPGHLQRLMGFAGISEEDQYASTLPKDIAVPTSWPEWAYFDELRASQKRITKAKEEENFRKPREAINFVPSTASGTSSGTGTPSGKGSRQSAAERVMSGLDRQQPGKRKELEQRGGRSDHSRSRRRSRSRSPKRRRSRSRDRR